MRRKIPDDAFGYYIGLGPSRSYEAVASKYGVSKRSVTRLAVREHWQQKDASIRHNAQAATEKRAEETIEAMTERHLRYLRAIQSRAVEALRNFPITSAMEAVRALGMTIREERLLRGEPTDRTALEIAEIVRRESERWLLPSESKDVGDGKASPTHERPDGEDADGDDQDPAAHP